MKQIVQRTMLVFVVALFVASVALYHWQPAEAAINNGSDSKDTVSTKTAKRTQATPTFNKNPTVVMVLGVKPILISKLTNGFMTL